MGFYFLYLERVLFLQANNLIVNWNKYVVKHSSGIIGIGSGSDILQLFAGWLFKKIDLECNQCMLFFFFLFFYRLRAEITAHIVEIVP